MHTINGHIACKPPEVQAPRVTGTAFKISDVGSALMELEVLWHNSCPLLSARRDDQKAVLNQGDRIWIPTRAAKDFEVHEIDGQRVTFVPITSVIVIRLCSEVQKAADKPWTQEELDRATQLTGAPGPR